MNKILLAPSVLSADFARLGEAVKLAESAGADLIHLDIMDGHFVPNLTFGPGLTAALKKITSLPLDVHLMVENPARFVQPFAEAGAEWISVHVEATAHLNRLTAMIKEFGCRAGVVLNPATPLVSIEEIMGDIDFVLLMSVNPGWGGQDFIPSIRKKIRKLRSQLDDVNPSAHIEVDGGIKLDNARELMEDGMSVVVAGSAIFNAPDPAAAVAEFKKIISLVQKEKA